MVAKLFTQKNGSSLTCLISSVLKRFSKGWSLCLWLCGSFILDVILNWKVKPSLLVNEDTGLCFLWKLSTFLSGANAYYLKVYRRKMLINVSEYSHLFSDLIPLDNIVKKCDVYIVFYMYLYENKFSMYFENVFPSDSWNGWNLNPSELESERRWKWNLTAKFVMY